MKLINVINVKNVSTSSNKFSVLFQTESFLHKISNPIPRMTSAFSSNDADAIERNIDTVPDGQLIQQIWNKTRCSECSAWITKNSFKKVN